jgi:hypothetical protein
MTGSRNDDGLPQSICTSTILEKAHNRITATADLPGILADSMHRPGPPSRPFVLATLRALRLDPGPYPMLSTRRPKASKSPGSNVLTGCDSLTWPRVDGLKWPTCVVAGDRTPPLQG